MNKKPFGTNGYHGVDISTPISSNSEPVGGDDFSGLKYVDLEASRTPGGAGPKSAGAKRGRLLRGFVILMTLALLVVGFFFWMGGGKKKIDLAVRDRSAQSEQGATRKTDEVTEQAIAEVRSGSNAAPSPSPMAAPSSAPAAATARDTAPVTDQLGGTVAAAERASAPNSPGVSFTGAPAKPSEIVSGRNTERSIRCAQVQKPVAPQSKQPITPDVARAKAGALPAPPPALEKTVTLPSFGALLPVRTLGAIYTLRPSLARFELTRDVRGDGWSMKKGTILVGQQQGSEYDRAYITLLGFIDPASGRLLKLAGDVLGSDGAPGLRGKRRQVSSRWARVLGRAANAAVSLGQAALSRGNSTTVVLPSAVTPELSLSQSVTSRREFVEAPAGAVGFVLITDLPKEARGADPQPVADNGGAPSLGDEELANLLTDGSPEQIRAALPRLTPELRQIAEAVLKESSSSDIADGPNKRRH
jgi:hypothetical protein